MSGSNHVDHTISGTTHVQFFSDTDTSFRIEICACSILEISGDENCSEDGWD